MILTLLLLAILTILVVVTFAVIALGGSLFIIIFGDVIVCIFIIGWLIKKLNKKK
jgi:hypothetical protein